MVGADFSLALVCRKTGKPNPAELFKLLIVLLADQFVVRKAEDLPSS